MKMKMNQTLLSFKSSTDMPRRAKPLRNLNKNLSVSMKNSTALKLSQKQSFCTINSRNMPT